MADVLITSILKVDNSALFSRSSSRLLNYDLCGVSSTIYYSLYSLERSIGTLNAAMSLRIQWLLCWIRFVVGVSVFVFARISKYMKHVRQLFITSNS